MKATAGAIVVLAVFLGLAELPAFAQSVISAQSGLIHFTTGRVLVNDRAVQRGQFDFPQMKEQDTLRAERGRAEVLLNPGVFLRVGENSSIRMISNRITDSRLELLSGAIVLEAAEIRKDSAVTVAYRDATISILKRGLYRLETDPAGLKVFDGKALVESGGQRFEVKKGKLLSFDGVWAARKFDRKQADAFDQWSNRRAATLARANFSAAQSLQRQRGGRLSASQWMWDPYLGLFTFMPWRGIYDSPYGYPFYSPGTVHRVYSAPSSSTGSQGGDFTTGGTGTSGGGSSGSSGGGSSGGASYGSSGGGFSGPPAMADTGPRSAPAPQAAAPSAGHSAAPSLSVAK